MGETDRDQHVYAQHDNLEHALTELKNDLSQIKVALLGDFNKSGMIQKVSDIEKRVCKLEIFVNEIKKQVSGMVVKIIMAAITGGLLTVGIDKVLN